MRGQFHIGRYVYIQNQDPNVQPPISNTLDSRGDTNNFNLRVRNHNFYLKSRKNTKELFSYDFKMASKSQLGVGGVVFSCRKHKILFKKVKNIPKSFPGLALPIQDNIPKETSAGPSFLLHNCVSPTFITKCLVFNWISNYFRTIYLKV